MAKDLACAGNLMRAQIKAGVSKETVAMALLKSWTKRLEALPTGLDDEWVEKLTLGVSEGPFDPAGQALLAELLMKKAGDGTGQAKTKNRRGMQHCRHFENMLTQDEWRKIRTVGIIPASVVQIISLRAWLIGLECPAELSTLKRMVSILSYALDTTLDQGQVKTYKESIQGAIKSLGTKRPAAVRLPYITEYPPTAAELPEVIRKYAYNETLPVNVCIPELDCLLGTSKMRPHVDMSWMKHIPPQYRHMINNHFGHPPPGQGCNLTFSPGATSAGSRSASLGEISGVFASPSNLRASAIMNMADSPPQLPLAPPAVPQADTTVVPQQEIPSDGVTHSDLDELEKGLLAAPSTLKKKPSGATEPVKASKPGKQSTAVKKTNFKKAPPPMKKPSAAAGAAKPVVASKINMSDIFDELKAAFGKISRGAFVTKAYKRAEKRMEASGASKVKCVAFAKENHAKASLLWNELSGKA